METLRSSPLLALRPSTLVTDLGVVEKGVSGLAHAVHVAERRVLASLLPPAFFVLVGNGDKGLARFVVHFAPHFAQDAGLLW